MSRAYYNEIEPFAAEWLRNLIDAGLIAPGDVDERDIQDVHPADLAGYTQCHFFAGIGAWSFALRLAGWPDDRPVWTGSCPCQPFSAAGERNGFDDERHLWPAWHHLIWQRRPPIIFGEQVASPDGWTWFDLVHDDMEGTGYACGAAVLPAASVGAPHIRHRLWFVADADPRGRPRECGRGEKGTAEHRGAGGLADAAGARQHNRAEQHAGRQRPSVLGASGRGWMDDAERERQHAGWHDHAEHDGQRLGAAGKGRVGNTRASRLPHAEPDGVARARRWEEGRAVEQPGRAFWSAAQWHLCRDSRYRAIEPGVFPLVDGAAGRVGRLRAYGNAIVPWVAAEFIAAALEARGEQATTLLDMLE